MIDSMDIKIALEMAALLKPLSTIHAMWIGGSVAEGYNDELSDIDLYIDIKDGQDETIFIIIKQFLIAKGKLDVKFTEGITPPYSHCVYHIAGMDPMNYIEVTLHTHSNQFGMFDKLRKIRVLFDKDDTVAFEPPNETEYQQMLKVRQSFLIEKIKFGELSVKKEIQRQQFPDAMHNYLFWLVEPIIELMRIKYSPMKITYNLKHASRDLPDAVVKEIEALYQVASLNNLNDKINHINSMLEKYGH